VCATYADGFRAGHVCSFIGIDAAKKARTFGEAIFERSKMIMRMMNIADFDETSIEIIGDNSQYSNKSSNINNREVVLKFAAKHQDIRAVGIMLKESVGLGLATPPGLSGFVGGRPKPSPIVRLFSFLIDKDQIKVTIDNGASNYEIKSSSSKEFNLNSIKKPSAPNFEDATDKLTDVPLIRVAYGRSGDKGNKANIGIIARDPKFYPAICNFLDEKVVKDCFSNFLEGSVERYFLPGSNSLNFVLNDVLGGGGPASLRNDPQGKAYAQILLDQTIPIPAKLID
jgi:hypothetical protein